MLYVIILRYCAPLDELDRHLDAHRAYLRRHYAAGHFLLSGRQEPRVGGIILARAESRAEIERWTTEDPFHQAGVAKYDIFAWMPNMRHEDVGAAIAPDAAIAA
jgi:uncharacterized protein YciI